MRNISSLDSESSGRIRKKKKTDMWKGQPSRWLQGISIPREERSSEQRAALSSSLVSAMLSSFSDGRSARSSLRRSGTKLESRL